MGGCIQQNKPLFENSDVYSLNFSPIFLLPMFSYLFSTSFHLQGYLLCNSCERWMLLLQRTDIGGLLVFESGNLIFGSFYLSSKVVHLWCKKIFRHNYSPTQSVLVKSTKYPHIFSVGISGVTERREAIAEYILIKRCPLHFHSCLLLSH